MTDDQQLALTIMAERAALYAVVILCIALMLLAAWEKWSRR